MVQEWNSNGWPSQTSFYVNKSELLDIKRNIPSVQPIPKNFFFLALEKLFWQEGSKAGGETAEILAAVFPLFILPPYLKINNHLDYCTAFVTGGTQLCFSFHWKAVMALSYANILYLKLFDSKLIHLKYDPKRLIGIYALVMT